jgi:hypothetical protein
MRVSTTRGATSCLATQWFTSIFQNSMVFATVPILSQISHSTPFHPLSTTSILMLSTHLRLGLPSSLFPLWLSYQWNVHIPLLPYSRDMLHPPHPPRLDNCNYTWRRVQSLSSSSCCFLCLPVILFLFGQNILLSTLFSNTLSLCSSHTVRNQVSRPYGTTSNILVLYILIFTFFDRRWEEKFPNWIVHIGLVEKYSEECRLLG